MDLEKLFIECTQKGIQQKKNEFIEFLKLCQGKKYKSILEIGAYSNGCTHAYNKLFEQVVSLDLIHRGEKINNVKYITGDSHSEIIIKEVVSAGKFDVIFIDGDHTFEGVSLDYNCYKHLLNKGGAIAFHDIWESVDCISQNCHVYKLWNELKNKFNYIEFGSENKTWAGIGVIFP